MIPSLRPESPPPLRRRLGLPAVAALVAGLGGPVPWQVYGFWGLCGAITLSGALTVAELTTLLP